MAANDILLVAVGMFCFGFVFGLFMFPWIFRIK
jgi:hypothetical protein